MMQENDLFTILDVVESTNNYAMAKVHAGLAAHGRHGLQMSSGAEEDKEKKNG